ncbi:MAG: ComEC/Rec2 family competence protein [Candidatus Cryosericum sp.]
MIRLRLVTLAALAVFLGAFSAGSSGATPALVFLTLAAAEILYAAQTKHLPLNLVRVMLALSLFWLGFALAGATLRSSAPGQLPPDTSVITGSSRTSSATLSSGGTSLELLVKTADGTPLKQLVTVTVQLPDRRSSYAAGQPLQVLGKLAVRSPALNPGEQRSGPQQPDIFLARDVQILPGNTFASWWGRQTKRVRDLVELRSRPLLNYRAFGLLEELLLHRKLFETADRQVFSMTGTSHLLAISGLHLSLVFALMSLLCGWTFSERSVGRTLAPLAVTLLYLAFIDFPLSADRAFVMLAVLTVTRLAGGHIGKLASLSWAVLVITLIDPTAVFDAGLQLSLASVAGLFFISEPLTRLFKPRHRLTRALSSSLAATIGASLPTAALIMSTFHIVAPVALIANIFAIPAVSLLLTGLLVWSAAILLLRPLTLLLTPILNAASVCLIGVLQFLSRFPGSHYNVSAPQPFLLASLGLLLGILIITVDNWPRLRTARRSTVPLGAAAVLVCVAFLLSLKPFDTRITFPVVDKGSVVLIQSATLGTWLCLFDTDAKACSRSVRAVAALGVNAVDVVAFTGPLTDLPEQLDSVFELLSPRHVYVPAMYAHTPIAGLAPQFQSTIMALPPGTMVSAAAGASTIRVGSTSDASPSLSVITAALAGLAGHEAPCPVPTAIPAFAYDTSAGTVRVVTTSSNAMFSLTQTGCISVFTRGSRCWVASDPRR